MQLSKSNNFNHKKVVYCVMHQESVVATVSTSGEVSINLCHTICT